MFRLYILDSVSFGIRLKPSSKSLDRLIMRHGAIEAGVLDLAEPSTRSCTVDSSAHVLTKQIRPVTPRSTSRSRSRSPPPVPTAEELEHAMNVQRILDREANPHVPCGDSDDEYYNF